MTAWEYLVNDLYVDRPSGLTEALNSFGRLGWELLQLPSSAPEHINSDTEVYRRLVWKRQVQVSDFVKLHGP